MNDVQNRFQRPRPHGVLFETGSGFPSKGEVPGLNTRVSAFSNGSSAPYISEPLNVAIAFYTNGVFTVSDGTPRSIDDPANAEFLDHIRRGICPVEISSVADRPVKVHLVRYGTDYKLPQKPNTSTFVAPLKAPSNKTGKASLQSINPPPSGSGPGLEQGEWEGADETKPTTSIQILLPDGSKVVARFNHNHTIRDIRRFVAAMRSDVSYTAPLRSGYPSRQITDEGQTIEDAGLVNAVVILK